MSEVSKRIRFLYDKGVTVHPGDTLVIRVDRREFDSERKAAALADTIKERLPDECQVLVLVVNGDMAVICDHH